MSVGQMTTIDMGIVIPLALSNMVVQQLLVCYIFINIQYHVTPFLFLFFFLSHAISTLFLAANEEQQCIAKSFVKVMLKIFVG